jgi:hypothetical protein
MKDTTRLPTRAELQKLLESLLPANEEMDEFSASIIIERAGVEPEAFTQGVRSRLESRAVEIRARGEEVPQALMDTLKILEQRIQDEEQDTAEADKIIGELLQGRVSGAEAEHNRSGTVHAFRSSGVELSEEDVRLLEEISIELRKQAGEE